MNLRRVAYGLAFATAIAAAIAPAQARELKASTHLPPKNDTVANGWVPFAKYVEDRTKGVLSHTADVDMPTAFAMLRRYARDHNQRLSELSRAVVHRETPASAVVEHSARRSARR